MEFWGAEVPAGKPLVVRPDEAGLIHISQASLDFKGKKGESALLYVKVDGKKLVIGTLSQETIPQISFDLVFEKEFELSHSLTKGSVHFVGYRSPNIDEEEQEFSDSEEEEDVPEAVPAPAVVAPVVKAETKQVAKPAEVKAESEDEEESDEDDESGEEDDGSDSEKGMDVDEDDSDDEDDSEDEEEEETPKQPEPINKKRANESAAKTPVSAKKAKPAVTPQKTEEKKKGGHTATPHPAKKGGKSPVNSNQSPKFGGQSSGGNKKPFNSGNSGKQFGSNNKNNKGKGKGRA